MTDHNEAEQADDGHSDLNIGKPVDDDYIDVEKRRADVTRTTDTQEDDKLDRAAPEEPPSSDGAAFDMSHLFDTGSGNGAASAIEELIDENAVIEHDGRASTRTFFYVGQAPANKRRQFARMLDYQEDKWSGMKNAQRAADRRRTLGTFCSQLEMNGYQERRARHIMEGLNMSHMAHYSSEKVILAILSLVANADGRFIRDERHFKRLLAAVDSDMNELKNVRALVRRKSDSL